MYSSSSDCPDYWYAFRCTLCLAAALNCLLIGAALRGVATYERDVQRLLRDEVIPVWITRAIRVANFPALPLALPINWCLPKGTDPMTPEYVIMAIGTIAWGFIGVAIERRSFRHQPAPLPQPEPRPQPVRAGGGWPATDVPGPDPQTLVTVDYGEVLLPTMFSFRHEDREIWSPGPGVAESFLSQVQFLERRLGMRSGLNAILSDDSRHIDRDQLHRFLSEILPERDLQNGSLAVLIDGTVIHLLAMLMCVMHLPDRLIQKYPPEWIRRAADIAREKMTRRTTGGDGQEPAA